MKLKKKVDHVQVTIDEVVVKIAELQDFLRLLQRFHVKHSGWTSGVPPEELPAQVSVTDAAGRCQVHRRVERRTQQSRKQKQ